MNIIGEYVIYIFCFYLCVLILIIKMRKTMMMMMSMVMMTIMILCSKKRGSLIVWAISIRHQRNPSQSEQQERGHTMK